jgi:hypothetical protein
MKIKLGTLRKIIREELKRTNLKELKLFVTGGDPMSKGGPGFHTGSESGPSGIKDLMSWMESSQDEDGVKFDEPKLIQWFKELGIDHHSDAEFYKVSAGMGGKQNIFGLDEEGNQVAVLESKPDGTHMFVSKSIDPASAAARQKYKFN